MILSFFPSLAKRDGEFEFQLNSALVKERARMENSNADQAFYNKCRAGVLGFNRKSTGCRRIVSFAPFGNLRHWLEANIQQCGLAAGDGAQSALYGLAHFSRLFDFFAVAIEGLDQ